MLQGGELAAGAKEGRRERPAAQKENTEVVQAMAL